MTVRYINMAVASGKLGQFTESVDGIAKVGQQTN